MWLLYGNVNFNLIFKGSNNELKSKRIYNEIFTCEFDLSNFPFDHQVCYIKFALVNRQAPVVKLLPNCQWALPVTSENRKVCNIDKKCIKFLVDIHFPFWI